MIPTSFDESNGRIDPPPGVDPDDCEILSVWRGPMANGQPVVVSCWKLTAEEIDSLVNGGRLWVYIWGTAMPPIALSGEHPFQESATDD